MSYDVTFFADVGGPEPVDLEDGWRNYTTNVAPMWAAALGGQSLGDLLDPEPVAETILPKIRDGIAMMLEAPDYFRAMNPANGWGDYEGAVEYLRWIAGCCERWPKARVRVWR